MNEKQKLPLGVDITSSIETTIWGKKRYVIKMLKECRIPEFNPNQLTSGEKREMRVLPVGEILCDVDEVTTSILISEGCAEFFDGDIPEDADSQDRNSPRRAKAAQRRAEALAKANQEKKAENSAEAKRDAEFQRAVQAGVAAALGSIARGKI